jgi:ribosomal protein S12 methylthiotransferase accessory factor
LNAFPDCDPAACADVLAARCRAIGITRVGRITGLDTIGLPVWFATRPNSRNLAVSQGKGLSDDAARIGAIMESIEGASAERSELLTDVTASIAELEQAGEPLLPFDAIYACEPAHLDPDRVRAWRRGRSLFTGGPVLAPLELVGLDIRVESGFDHRAMRVSSVGLAAHVDRDAALLHGLLEVIENDATAVLDTFPKAITRFSPVDPESATRADLRHWLARLAAEGVAVHLRDISTDVALPCIAAVVSMPGAPGRYAAGYACRFDAEAAALAALMEAIQSRLTQISGARDDMEEESYTGTHALMNVLSPNVATKRFSDFAAVPVAAQAPVAARIDHVKEALRRAEVADAFVFDFPPLIEGVSVTKAIVADLQIAFDDGPTRIGPRILREVMR